MRVGRLALAFPLVLGACFSYRPVTSVTRPAGSRVQVLLSDAGAARLAPRIGERVSEVEGVVLASDESALTVSLMSLKRRGEGTVGWAGERLTLERADMAVVQERVFSKTRTAWTAASVGAVVALVVATVGENIFGGGSDDGPVIRP